MPIMIYVFGPTMKFKEGPENGIVAVTVNLSLIKVYLL